MKRMIVLSVAAMTAWAAFGAIVWDAPQRCAGDTDVATTGVCLFAYTAGSSAMVNGVPFSAELTVGKSAQYLLMPSGIAGSNASAFSSGSNPFNSLSAAYKNILRGSVYASSGSTQTVTLRGLHPGVDYLVQFWANDPRAAQMNRYLFVDGNATLTLDHNFIRETEDNPPEIIRGEGGVGAYIVGRFTAAGFTQTFSVTGGIYPGTASSPSTQINAIQLRRISEIPVATARYWDTDDSAVGFGLASGTWGLDPFWSLDPAGASAPEIGVTTTGVDDALYLGTAATGLGAGAIAVGGQQAFRSLTFGQASGPLTLGGAGTLRVDARAEILLNANTNTLAAALAGPTVLAVKAQGIPSRHAGPTFVPATSVTDGLVLFPNTTLADYTGAACSSGGGSITGRVYDNASVFFWTSDGTNATFQMQSRDDANYTKCVKVRLEQVGPDVVARGVYAKYTSGNVLGQDFDVIASTGANVTQELSVSGYGVTNLRLLPYRGTFVSCFPMLPLANTEHILTAESRLLATNCSLSDVTGLAGTFSGGSISYKNGPARVYHLNRVDERTLTAQFQIFEGDALITGCYTKCVKAEFTQVGADIWGKAVYARYYATQGVNMLGYNFDTGGSNQGISINRDAGGYGIRYLTFLMEGPLPEPQTLALVSQTNAFSGDLTIADGATVLTEWRLNTNGTYAGTLDNNGTFRYRSAASENFSGALNGSSGKGALVIGEKAEGTDLTFDANFLTTTPQMVFPNARLADYQSAYGWLGGSSVANGPVFAAGSYFSNDGQTATVQLQIENGSPPPVYTKCVKVELTQVGSDIHARAVYAKYTTGGSFGFNFDLGGTSVAVATSAGTSYYGVPSLTLSPGKQTSPRLAWNASGFTGKMIVESGVTTVAALNALPQGGGIHVRGGNLVLDVSGLVNTANIGGSNPITVYRDGTLTALSAWNVGHSRLLTLDGGTLNITAASSSSTIPLDGVQYINNLTLKDGARIIGRTPRVGYTIDGVWRVQGTSPSFVETMLALVSANWTLDVEDVTGDSAPDVFFTGARTNYPSEGPLTWRKRGEGTASIAGDGTGYTGPLVIEGGAIRLDAPNAFSASTVITLNGGWLEAGNSGCTVGAITAAAGGIDLSRGTGTLTSAGALTLAGDTAIRLGTGAVAFADTSAALWAEGATLNLIGDLPRRTVRFGTTQNGLTPEQLRQIRLNGVVKGSLGLDPDGYLKESRGTILLIR